MKPELGWNLTELCVSGACTTEKKKKKSRPKPEHEPVLFYVNRACTCQNQLKSPIDTPNIGLGAFMCEEDIVDWGPFMFEERDLRIYLPNSLRDHCHWHLQQLDNKLALKISAEGYFS